MSTAQGEIRIGDAAAPPAASRRLGLAAQLYFGVIAVATVAAAAPAIARLDTGTSGWASFLILAACAALAQLFVVRTTRDQSYHTSIVFLIAAALLLPPELVALMAVVQHIPEWLKVRYVWYIQLFNICNYTLNGLAAWGTAHLINTRLTSIGSNERWALAGLAACVVFVVLQHTVLAAMLYLARGHRPGETGLFSPAMLSTELVLAALGIGFAAFWELNPFLLPAALAPLLLIHRSLHVPRLEEQARVDPKTGLFNARHFAAVLNEELSRGERFDRPVSLLMADLDLLREINNTHGHLAGDEVLAGIADVFRKQLRHYDVPARFGGEEFAILLPETAYEDAVEIAERIRRGVATHVFDVETSSEPIRATLSLGVASFPLHARDPKELIHQADLAVYRAKLQGRNRVVSAGGEGLAAAAERPPRLVALPAEPPPAPAPSPPLRPVPVAHERRRSHTDRRKPSQAPAVPRAYAAFVVAVAAAGILAGIAGAVFGRSDDILGMLAVAIIVGAGQALAVELQDGSISVGAVGAIAAAALFDVRAALGLAVISAVVEWSARRSPVRHVLLHTGALSLGSIAAAGVFAAEERVGLGHAGAITLALVAGSVLSVVAMGLVSAGTALASGERWRVVWRERFGWLVVHYAAYGVVAGVLVAAYREVGAVALAIAVVPLLLMRKTQAAYLTRTARSADQLRAAAETIRSQNVSLEHANRLLRERSTAAMESLSATVDARDAFTAGHSRRVQRLALAIGRELELSPPELELLGHAALFHDIGKLAIPDAILMKPEGLDRAEWGLMRRHSDEGARIIDRLGFLEDAVPAIRHHHERFDGTGYPDGLSGEEIPLGARIIHVADAVDSMLTPRVYRAALTAEEALAELQSAAGTQFCPRCVRALEQALKAEAAGSAVVTLLAS